MDVSGLILTGKNQSTVKSAVCGTSGTKGLADIATSRISEYCAPYVSWSTYQPHGQSNHFICHLISCPVFHAALSTSFHHYLRNKGQRHLDNITQQVAPYLT
jgi:hypothetical protein